MALFRNPCVNLRNACAENLLKRLRLTGVKEYYYRRLRKNVRPYFTRIVWPRGGDSEVGRKELSGNLFKAFDPEYWGEYSVSAFLDLCRNMELKKHQVDMVVLSIGVVPPEDIDRTQQQLTLQKSAEGFFLEAHPKLKPVDAATQGIFFAGCAEGPKDIKDSVTQASAAAARANRLMRAGEVMVEAITSMVDDQLCISCGICARVCPYHAISVDTKKKTPAVVVEAACAGCGTCAAECPYGAISMKHFTDRQIIAQIESALATRPEEKIVTFACNWCSYPGADLAGTNRLQYPPNARVIRTMCSGRVDERFIWYAFRLGAPIVLVSGCHFADCHYINAVTWTQKRVEKIWDKMEALGIRPERLQLEYISAAEGQKWARVMGEVENLRQAVTRKEVEKTRKVIGDELLGKKTPRRKKPQPAAV